MCPSSCAHCFFVFVFFSFVFVILSKAKENAAHLRVHSVVLPAFGFKASSTPRKLPFKDLDVFLFPFSWHGRMRLVYLFYLLLVLIVQVKRSLLEIIIALLAHFKACHLCNNRVSVTHCICTHKNTLLRAKYSKDVQHFLTVVVISTAIPLCKAEKEGSIGGVFSNSPAAQLNNVRYSRSSSIIQVAKLPIVSLCQNPNPPLAEILKVC